MHGGDIYRNQVHMDFSVNLNPLGTPDEVMRAVCDALPGAHVYPDPEQAALRQVIAEAIGCRADAVVAGNGVSELLMVAVRAEHPKQAVVFAPAFSGYAYALEALGCRIHSIVADEKTGLCFMGRDLDAIPADTDMIFVCDPANPTGQALSEEALTALLHKTAGKGITVCLDESFRLLSDQWAEALSEKRLSLLETYDHLLFLRSFTKVLAMPGIRAGYAVSSPERIQRIRRQLPEWNLSVCSEAMIRSGIHLLYETGFAEESVKEIQKERDFLSKGLKEAALPVCESSAPFLLFRGPVQLQKKLLLKGILIRDCSDFAGLSEGTYRIAVKSRKDNQTLLAALKEVLHEL